MDHHLPTALPGWAIMSNSRRPHSRIWLRPIVVWAILVLLALASVDAAYHPLHAVGTLLNLAVAAAMVILLWLFLMDLIGSDTLLRLISIAGLLWLSFMFALTFSDYLFRPCKTPGDQQNALCTVQNLGRRVF
jgi:caa(3)-type oxidase subunit IV